MNKKPHIVFCAYRDWATSIYRTISKKYKDSAHFHLIESKEDFTTFFNAGNRPNMIFFVGWSWILPKEVVQHGICICLHPSPLPRYRGGSPIQNQIINGEKESALTLFVMDEKIDHGAIAWQKSFSLAGDLQNVLDRIAQAGLEGIDDVLRQYFDNGKLHVTPQDEKRATYFKRRTPDMSEIKPKDFLTNTAEQIYDKVRALQDPYPNAYIVCKGNTKLYLQNVKVDSK